MITSGCYVGRRMAALIAHLFHGRGMVGIGIVLAWMLTGCIGAATPFPQATVSTPLPTSKPAVEATRTSSPQPTVEATHTPIPQPTMTSAPTVTAAPTPTARPTPAAATPTTEAPVSAAGYALHFFGTGSGDIDRVKVKIDNPPVPADIGATDFTLEWWMKASLADNTQTDHDCGSISWIFGNIIFDRDRYNLDRKFGVSMRNGKIFFGMSGNGTGDLTICGVTNVADGQWHHVAVERRRSDGYLWLFVDGAIDAEGQGPGGDVSYPNGAVNPEGWPNDPYLVIGAEKHDAGSDYPSFNGWIDEVRLSTVLRYADPFKRPTARFEPDANTAALWHFDEGTGTIAQDSAPGGASVGQVRVGGPHSGPHWEKSDAPLFRPAR